MTSRLTVSGDTFLQVDMSLRDTLDVIRDDVLNRMLARLPAQDGILVDLL